MACPLLILLALAAFLQRPGADRVQALPALAIGCGLVSLRVIRRRRRRRELLDALRLHR
jgi:NAD(P)H-hydrate repair Nnr-like enzyme with NAD(P)H-hydrate dehydratase domain